MITGGKIIEVSAEKKSDEKNTGLEYDIKLSDLKRNGKIITVTYNYTINYKPEMAVMKIKGELNLEFEEARAKTIEEAYKKNKFVPTDVAEEVLNASNYTTTSIGTLLAFAIGVGAPINLPKTKLEQMPASGIPKPKAS
jgi:hypothetical protein